jgi:tRNA-splicing ligase RtcB
MLRTQSDLAAPELALHEESPYRWRVEARGEMRVPGIVFASRALLLALRGDRSLEHVVNVATLPGIVTASYMMPDVHWGYGFPIGDVAATHVHAGGVVSPGGVGFDTCGVRLLVAASAETERCPRLDQLMDALGKAVPRGLGKGACGNCLVVAS